MSITKILHLINYQHLKSIIEDLFWTDVNNNKLTKHYISKSTC